MLHATRQLSLFGSRSNNTALPPGFLDPNNQQLPGVASKGHDVGFSLALRDEAISLRVNFYEQDQQFNISDAQEVRQAAAVIEQRLRGTDRPPASPTYRPMATIRSRAAPMSPNRSSVPPVSP